MIKDVKMYYVIKPDGHREYYSSKKQAKEAAYKYSKQIYSSIGSAEPGHTTDIEDLQRYYDKYSKYMTWEEYKAASGLAGYGEKKPTYYKVKVTSSTGKTADVIMSEKVYEKYREAKEKEARKKVTIPEMIQIQRIRSPQETAEIGSPFREYSPEKKEAVMTKRRKVSAEYPSLLGVNLGEYGIFAKSAAKSIEHPMQTAEYWKGDIAELGIKISKKGYVETFGEAAGSAFNIAALASVPETAETGIKIGRGIATRIAVRKPPVEITHEGGILYSYQLNLKDFTIGLGRGESIVNYGKEAERISTRHFFTVEPAGKARKATVISDIIGKNRVSVTTADILKEGKKTRLENIMTLTFRKPGRKFMDVREYGKPEKWLELESLEVGRGTETEKWGNIYGAELLKKRQFTEYMAKLFSKEKRGKLVSKGLDIYARERAEQKIIGKWSFGGKAKPRPITPGKMKPMKSFTFESEGKALKTLMKEQMSSLTKTAKKSKLKPFPKAASTAKTSQISSLTLRQLSKSLQRQSPNYASITGLKTGKAASLGMRSIAGQWAGARGAQKMKQLLRTRTAQKQDLKTILRTDVFFRAPKPRGIIGGKMPRIAPVTFPVVPPAFKSTKMKTMKLKVKGFKTKKFYTPSLGGALGLVKPVTKAPKTLTGLRIRPVLKKRRR